ncbi:MAG TPA: uroporphyrinogen decarboxylase family protein [Anaerolineales bacterium]|nr:uroporphyrinogen decarboxylase family protein [Anaerolineales bacterium]
MNSYERVMNRLQGEPVDRTPNFDIVMGFGMRYLGKPLRGYFLDHRTLCEAHLAVAQAFEIDVVSIIADSYRESSDLGADVEYPEDDLPRPIRPLFSELQDFADYRLPDPLIGRRMGDAVEGCRLFRQQVGGEIPVMGWVEGALAQANILVGDQPLLYSLYDRPAWVHDLLELCTQVEIAFARAQIEAGADIIGLGDAIASLVSPQMYREFALPYEQRIFQAIHAAGAIGRLHICGNTARILVDMLESGADMIDIDWMVDIQKAAQIFGERVALCGNFDPVAVMLQGTPGQVAAAVRFCLEHGGRRYISAAGCEIPEGTPHSNLLTQARVLGGFE